MKLSFILAIIAGVLLGLYVYVAVADTLCVPICYDAGGQQVCNVLCS